MPSSRSTDRIRTDQIRAAKEAAILELSEGTKREIAKLEKEVETNPLASSQIHMLKSQDTVWNEIRDIRSDLIYMVEVVQKVEHENKNLSESTRAFGFWNPGKIFPMLEKGQRNLAVAVCLLAVLTAGSVVLTGILWHDFHNPVIEIQSIQRQ